MSEKKSIRDVHLANDKLLQETAKLNGTTKTNVENIINFVGNYASNVIRTGVMESVMIPGFGKFKPKEKVVLARHNARIKGANGKEIIWRALTGRKIIDRRVTKPDTDETV